MSHRNSFHDDDSESEEKVDVSSSSTTIEIDHAYKEGKEDIHVSSHGTRKSRNAFFFFRKSLSSLRSLHTHKSLLLSTISGISLLHSNYTQSIQPQ